MSRVAYVDGRYRPLGEAAVHIEDRGYQFADAIYEVWAVRDGRLLDMDGHLKRLARSLGELRIKAPIADAALMAVLRETLRRNQVRDGIVYLQISRGVAPRDHAFPNPDVKPTIVVTAKALDARVYDARAQQGVSVITLPDERWARCDIKTVSLLPNVLAKQRAKEAGAYEAWLLDGDGFVTEGTSSNAWIVDTQGRLVTRDLSHHILHGVTRAAVMKLAAERQISVVEKAFTPDEARAAREAFLTSAANAIMPIVGIDGTAVGKGEPGPIALALREAYFGTAKSLN